MHLIGVSRKRQQISNLFTRLIFHTHTDSIVTVREESNMAMQQQQTTGNNQLDNWIDSGFQEPLSVSRNELVYHRSLIGGASLI